MTERIRNSGESTITAIAVAVPPFVRGGAALVVAVIPAEAQVEVAHQRRLAALLDRPAGALDFMQPSRSIVAALTAAGIETVDLTPAFVARGGAAALYKPQDSHWNIAGNALAAEVLRPSLERHRPATPAR